MTGGVAERVGALTATASIEVTPRDAGNLAALGDLLPQGTGIYITALPGADPGNLAPAAVAVRAAGHVPVPHIAVRGYADLDHVNRVLGALVADAQVDDVLVVAGGLKQPVGTLQSSFDVLESGLLEAHGIARVGLAGHPEGSPDISEQQVAEALARKNELAETLPFEFRIVTQFALAGGAYVEWERGIRAAGNRLPVVTGIPGVTSPPRLLKFALACGIGPSIEVLRKQSGGLLKLATTRSWKPDEVVTTIAESIQADPGSLIRGLHVFPFGGLEASAEWLAEQRTARATLSG
jgi:methylenetetrahydrofolate reductase (NADPH)